MSSQNSHQTKAERREAARVEALALREKQLARDKRNRTITIGVLAAALVALGVVVWLILQQGGKPAMEGVSAPTTATMNESTGIPMGESGAAGTTNDGAVEVGVYLDYMCPICGDFESTNGATLDALREAGDVTVVLHPVSILDRFSQGSEFSTRAAAAAAWVADRAPEQMNAFNAAMFANQPEENTAGLTDEQIAQIAEGAGVPADVAEGITNGDAHEAFGDWAAAATEAATGNAALSNPSSRGFGTPTITIDGKRWDGNWSQTGALQAAVEDAAGS